MSIEVILTCIMIALIIFSIFLWVRNIQTYALLTIAGKIILVWSMKQLEDENFDWQKNWYKELLKRYSQVLLNPFATQIKHVFKDKNKFEEIMSVLSKEDILKIKKEGMKNVI